MISWRDPTLSRRRSIGRSGFSPAGRQRAAGLAICYRGSRAWPPSIQNLAPGWGVFTDDPGAAARSQGNGLGFVGGAQEVCLNASAPTSCPSGAFLYGFPVNGWFADLSILPRAAWVWAPGITQGESPAEFASYYFSRSFVLAGPPTAGTVYLAADDFAELLVNGIAAGSVGSITDVGLAGQAQSGLTASTSPPCLSRAGM